MLVLIKENEVQVENTVISDIGYNSKNLDKLTSLDKVHIEEIPLMYISDTLPEVNSITYHKDVKAVKISESDNEDFTINEELFDDSENYELNEEKEKIIEDSGVDLGIDLEHNQSKEDLNSDNILDDIQTTSNTDDSFTLGEDIDLDEIFRGDIIDEDTNSTVIESSQDELNSNIIDDVKESYPALDGISIADDLDISIDSIINRSGDINKDEEITKVGIINSSPVVQESFTYRNDDIAVEDEVDVDTLWVINLRKKKEDRSAEEIKFNKVVKDESKEDIFKEDLNIEEDINIEEDVDAEESTQSDIQTNKASKKAKNKRVTNKKPKQKKNKSAKKVKDSSEISKSGKKLFAKDKNKQDKKDGKKVSLAKYLTSSIDSLPEDYKKLILTPTLMDEEIFISRRKSKNKQEKEKVKNILMDIVTPARFLTDENNAVIYTKVHNKSTIPSGNSGLTDLKQLLKEADIKDDVDFDLVMRDDNGVLYQTWMLYPDCIRTGLESVTKSKKNYIINKIMSVEEAIIKSMVYSEEPRIIVYRFPMMYKVLFIKRDLVYGYKEFSALGTTMEKIENEIDLMVRTDIFSEWIESKRIFLSDENLTKAVKLGSLTGGGYGAIYSRARYYLGT